MLPGGPIMKPVDHVVAEAAVKAKRAADAGNPLRSRHAPSTANRAATGAIWAIAILSLAAMFWFR